MNVLTIELPVEALPSPTELPDDFADEARFLLALKLFEQGRISSGKAGTLCGLGRVGFLLAARAEVIALANASRPCLAIIDEKRGRRIAARVYGLPIKGTPGLLVEAHRRCLLDDLPATLHGLKREGYFLADALIDAACKAADRT